MKKNIRLITIINILFLSISTIKANEVSRYMSETSALHLLNVEVPEYGNYNVVLNLVETTPDLIFELRSTKKRSSTLVNTEYFSFNSGMLEIPVVEVFNKQWSALLELKKNSDPLRFKVINAGSNSLDSLKIRITDIKYESEIHVEYNSSEEVNYKVKIGKIYWEGNHDPDNKTPTLIVGDIEGEDCSSSYLSEQFLEYRGSYPVTDEGCMHIRRHGVGGFDINLLQNHGSLPNPIEFFYACSFWNDKHGVDSYKIKSKKYLKITDGLHPQGNHTLAHDFSYQCIFDK
ncbi:MAG: hypothetical protein V3U87_10815 [Methylococcaceae bacterium]